MIDSILHSHDPRTMEDFYRPSLIGRRGPIVPKIVPGTHFVLKNHMVQLLRQNYQFHAFKGEDANTHLDKALQLRKDILNFQQLPTELVFEVWERFKSCLRKCHDHRILLDHQILTFYHGITIIDRDKIMVWDAEVYYDTTTGVSAHYSETTSALSAQIEVLGNNTGYTIQSIQHQPGPGHPNTFYYSYSDESDEDEPSEESTVQKLIHLLSGSPTPSSNSIIADSYSFFLGSLYFYLVEETDTVHLS
ncbi:hypothetical protein Tco_0686551 [Tanacetum coccineum]